MNKTNSTNINFNKSNINNNNNIYRKTNLYNLKKNYKKEKSPVIRLKDYLTTDDFIINKNINNRNSSLYPLVITEESKKKNMNDKKSKSKIKKTESVSNTFIKKNHSSIKKLKTSSTSILNKKTNIILNTNNNIKNNSNNTQIDFTDTQKVIQLMKDQNKELKINKKKLEKLEEKFVKVNTDLKNIINDKANIEDFISNIFPKDMISQVLKKEYGTYDKSELSKFVDIFNTFFFCSFSIICIIDSSWFEISDMSDDKALFIIYSLIVMPCLAHSFLISSLNSSLT